MRVKEGETDYNTMMNKAKQLRHRLLGDQPVVAMGGHDGMSAKLAEHAGFGAVWASGLEISTSAGVPDANILTMTDFLAAAREMDAATALPIIADCDTGFGNSNNVIHMVRGYETSGIAALCIEDKLFPKVNSFIPGRQELATVWEFAGKIMAAKHAQALPDLVVIARLESLIAGRGVDDALRRADAYHRAGADMILIHSKDKTAGPVLEFLRHWQRRSPVAVVPTTFPELTVDDWRDQGVNLVIYANHGLRAAIDAMEKTYAKILASGSTVSVEDEISPLSRVFELQGMPQMKLEEHRFLKNLSGSDVRAIIPAAGTVVAGDLEEKLGAAVPRPMLDIYGRTILQRQVDALSSVGVQQVSLVSDLPAETVVASGSVEAIAAPGGGLLQSIYAGLLSPGESDRTLICFCDLLFESSVLDVLFQSEGDITLLVDRTFQETRSQPRKASLDLVLTDPAPSSDLRVLKQSPVFTVKAISKSLSVEESHFEFVGMVLLSTKGAELFREGYRRYAAPEHAFETGTASLNDFLGQLIDDGVTVQACEIRRGWLEVHDFEDYKAAVEQVRSR